MLVFALEISAKAATICRLDSLRFYSLYLAILLQASLEMRALSPNISGVDSKFELAYKWCSNTFNILVGVIKLDFWRTNGAVNQWIFILLFVILVKAIFLSHENKSFCSTESRRDNENFSEIEQAARMQIVGRVGANGVITFCPRIIQHNPLKNPGSVLAE